MDNWYSDYKDYKAWLEEGNPEPEMDNPSSDWEECMQSEVADLQMWERENNLFDDYWFEYNLGERANDT